MQNYIFRSREAAQAARTGAFDLVVCPACGFAHNACYDPSLLDYDQGYDNTVESSVMTAYYGEIAAFLHEEHSLDDGLVVDVGCGKGTFLRVLCGLFPKIRGLGIDPTYDGPTRVDNGRLRFIKDFFCGAYVTERPALVVCRHVIEHIPDPASFMAAIHSALAGADGTPLFVEVPDTNWIVEESAFWDFCYEHCNYFTASSLAKVLEASGFTPTRLHARFGDQYLWQEGVRSAGRVAPRLGQRDPAAARLARELERCGKTETAWEARVRERIDGLRRDGWSIAVWGMATKGVLFCVLVDPERALFRHCIDMNPRKQGCFVPVTGHLIESPAALRWDEPGRVAVVVMNPNYASEIRDTCSATSVRPLLIDAHGVEL